MKITHGDDINQYKQEIVSNFSTTIYQATDLSNLTAYLASRLDCIRHYPDSNAGELETLISREEGVTPGHVVVASGVEGAIKLVWQLAMGSLAAQVVPCYNAYTEIYQESLSFPDLDSILHPRTNGTSLMERYPQLYNHIWISNPNNPTGAVIPKEELKRFIEAMPDHLICIDQSCEFFTEKELFSASEAAEYPNVILVHSMSQKYAIPGLRLGYITASRSLCKQLRQFRTPWSLDALSIEAGTYLLKRGKGRKMLPHLPSLLTETKRLRKAIRALGINLLRTDTHYFVCQLPKKKMLGTDLKKYLIEEQGILIRDGSGFQLEKEENSFRIAAQTPEENDRLVLAIEEWLQKQSI